tara:strand:- start:23 stop:514 length:492 start_codon:yes stop_codon:yes gene_type:complete
MDTYQKIKTKVILNNQEIALATWIGKGRQATAERRKLYNLNQCGADDEWMHINGAAGELAFCKLFKIYPHSFLDELGNNCSYDAWIDGVGGVDIKTSTSMNGCLNVEYRKRYNPADNYALMTGDGVAFNYRGMISKELLFMERNIKDVGNGNYYAIDQGQLFT